MNKIILFIAILSISLSLFPRIVMSPIVTQADEYSIFFSAWGGSSWSTPVEVVEVAWQNCTSFVQQKKTWKATDNSYWIAYLNATSDYGNGSGRRISFQASLDGTTWIATHTGHSTYFTNHLDDERFGWVDIIYPIGKSSCDGILLHPLSNDRYNHRGFNTSGTTYLPDSTDTFAIIANSDPIASGANNLNNERPTHIRHRNGTGSSDEVSIYTSTTERCSDTTIDYMNGSSVSVQVLRINSTVGATEMLCLAKDDDGLLCWLNYSQYSCNGYPWHDNQVVQLESGINDWCGTSEIHEVGDTERIHLVFRNSTNIYYMQFTPYSWSSITNLNVTGEYPTISVDTSGNIMVTYARSGQVYYLYNDGCWRSETQLGGNNYRNAGYLSSNQNEQNNDLLVIWTANEYSSVDGQLEGMLNTLSTFLGVIGAVGGIGFVLLFLGVGTYFIGTRTIDTGHSLDIIIKPLIAITFVGIAILVIALLNVMTV